MPRRHLHRSRYNARKKVNKDKSLWLASQSYPAAAGMLPVMLSEGYHERKLPLQRICQPPIPGKLS